MAASMHRLLEQRYKSRAIGAYVSVKAGTNLSSHLLLLTYAKVNSLGCGSAQGIAPQQAGNSADQQLDIINGIAGHHLQVPHNH